MSRLGNGKTLAELRASIPARRLEGLRRERIARLRKRYVRKEWPARCDEDRNLYAIDGERWLRTPCSSMRALVEMAQALVPLRKQTKEAA